MDDRRRRWLAATCVAIGVAVIVVNSFGQEALGWDFLPGGLIGAVFLGIGFGKWREHRSPSDDDGSDIES